MLKDVEISSSSSNAKLTNICNTNGHVGATPTYRVSTNPLVHVYIITLDYFHTGQHDRSSF